MVRVELLETVNGVAIYGVVDYITGKREIRFQGPAWACLTLITAAVGPLPLAQA